MSSARHPLVSLPHRRRFDRVLIQKVDMQKGLILVDRLAKFLKLNRRDAAARRHEEDRGECVCALPVKRREMALQGRKRTA